MGRRASGRPLEMGPSISWRNRKHGQELWRSDGTAGGTSLVKDIVPGRDSKSLWDLTFVGETLYFEADDGPDGPGLGGAMGRPKAQPGPTDRAPR